MLITPLTIPANYWDTLEITEHDLEELYNHLIEVETPLTSAELVKALISNRINEEKINLDKQLKGGADIYTPKEHYQVDQVLKFPSMNWTEGKITHIREGKNPEYSPFEVIDVTFTSGEEKSFAAALATHTLNQLPEFDSNDPLLNLDKVLKDHGKKLVQKLTSVMEDNPDLVVIAGRWFPSALLVDVNQGHLNLAEAVLEMENGGPLPTSAILSQIELPTDVNAKLTEFSLNYALQEDGRFDEVGPSGETMWFLRHMEPDGVQTPPIWLRPVQVNVDPVDVAHLLKQMNPETCDELEKSPSNDEEPEEITIRLIYPHWRAGTLPLTDKIARLFPTAYEAPRVQFTFVDSETGQRFSSWVVRVQHYVYGLREWFLSIGAMPGSLITIQKGKIPGEVILKTGKRRPIKDWVRTALIGTDGGIVYATLKQQINIPMDEHMGIVLSNPLLLDPIWEQPKAKLPFEQMVTTTMRELSRLNPQGHVHAGELYAAINLVRRCPPTPVLQLLQNKPWAIHLGDLYYRLDESQDERTTDE